MYKDQNLIIRPIEEMDLPRIWELEYNEEKPEWKKWNAPYYPHETKSFDEFLPIGRGWVNQSNVWVIEVDGILCGTVSYYWEHEPSKWLEMGILFYEGGDWGKGLGTRTLKLWINHLFNSMPLVRVGFTTWSGNERMIRVGEKLGMQLEARIRKVRYYEGEYYDSIRMGILREEWEAQNSNQANKDKITSPN